MSQILECNECGIQSNDPKAIGWKLSPTDKFNICIQKKKILGTLFTYRYADIILDSDLHLCGRCFIKALKQAIKEIENG